MEITYNKQFLEELIEDYIAVIYQYDDDKEKKAVKCDINKNYTLNSNKEYIIITAKSSYYINDLVIMKIPASEIL